MATQMLARWAVLESMAIAARPWGLPSGAVGTTSAPRTARAPKPRTSTGRCCARFSRPRTPGTTTKGALDSPGSRPALAHACTSLLEPASLPKHFFRRNFELRSEGRKPFDNKFRAKISRNLGGLESKFRKEIWVGRERNSHIGQVMHLGVPAPLQNRGRDKHEACGSRRILSCKSSHFSNLH